MGMNRFREKKISKLFWLIICYGLIFLVFNVNCFADEVDVGFNSYPELPDLSSDSAVPDLFTGTMSKTIPIKVPPGRNGMSPSIALTYRSSNGNGPIGMGWEIEMGAIQRSTRGGVDYTKDNYQWCKTGGTMDLVHLSSSPENVYGAKSDGEFTRIRKLTASDGYTYWEATNKAGTRFLFGQTWDSRQFGDSSKIFKWCLDKVVDTNGNYMTLKYFNYQGQSYLSEIEYTGNGAMGPTNMVKFYYYYYLNFRSS